MKSQGSYWIVISGLCSLMLSSAYESPRGGFMSAEILSMQPLAQRINMALESQLRGMGVERWPGVRRWAAAAVPDTRRPLGVPAIGSTGPRESPIAGIIDQARRSRLTIAISGKLCQFLGMVDQPVDLNVKTVYGNGDRDYVRIIHGYFRPVTGEVSIILVYRNSQEGYFYLADANGMLVRAAHLSKGPAGNRILALDDPGVQEDFQEQVRFWLARAAG